MRRSTALAVAIAFAIAGSACGKAASLCERYVERNLSCDREAATASEADKQFVRTSLVPICEQAFSRELAGNGLSKEQTYEANAKARTQFSCAAQAATCDAYNACFATE